MVLYYSDYQQKNQLFCNWWQPEWWASLYGSRVALRDKMLKGKCCNNYPWFQFKMIFKKKKVNLIKPETINCNNKE